MASEIHYLELAPFASVAGKRLLHFMQRAPHYPFLLLRRPVIRFVSRAFGHQYDYPSDVRPSHPSPPLD